MRIQENENSGSGIIEEVKKDEEVYKGVWESRVKSKEWGKKRRRRREDGEVAEEGKL